MERAASSGRRQPKKLVLARSLFAAQQRIAMARYFVGMTWVFSVRLYNQSRVSARRYDRVAPISLV